MPPCSNRNASNHTNAHECTCARTLCTVSASRHVLFCLSLTLETCLFPARPGRWREAWGASAWATRCACFHAMKVARQRQGCSKPRARHFEYLFKHPLQLSSPATASQQGAKVEVAGKKGEGSGCGQGSSFLAHHLNLLLSCPGLTLPPPQRGLPACPSVPGPTPSSP